MYYSDGVLNSSKKKKSKNKAKQKTRAPCINKRKYKAPTVNEQSNCSKYTWYDPSYTKFHVVVYCSSKSSYAL